MNSTPIAFVDTETTHLDPRHGDAWEIAVIRREDGIDTEYLWQIRPDLDTADPEALAIGKYHERFAVPDGWDAIQAFATEPPWRLTLSEMLFDLQDALANAVVVGSNPGFDIAFLTKLLQAHSRKLPWHYRPVDIAILAAGYLRGYDLSAGETSPELTLPYSSRALSRAVGVEPPGDDIAHTALGDAHWARDVYDAIHGRV